MLMITMFDLIIMIALRCIIWHSYSTDDIHDDDDDVVDNSTAENDDDSDSVVIM